MQPEHPLPKDTLSPKKSALFWLVTLSIPTLCAAGLWSFWRYREIERLDGKKLNSTAWEASFAERGLRVPEGGPRDGYWGKKMPAWVRDSALDHHEAEVHRPGFVEEDAKGMQQYAVPGARAHLLIIGGSVAWGAYASTEDETYFAQAARLLKEAGWPVHFTILAAGAWMATNELNALTSYNSTASPDVVIFLDGLNDVTYRKGTEATRVTDYVDRLHRARDLAEAKGSVFVVALQPALSLKHHKSRLEKRIIELTPKAGLVPGAYARMRIELAGLADESGARFVDCSEALSGERATTFTDIWHFADPGHRLLGRCLAEGLLPVLKALRKPQESLGTKSLALSSTDPPSLERAAATSSLDP